MEERDLLVKQVFPALRRRVQVRGVEVVDVGMRRTLPKKRASRTRGISICLIRQRWSNENEWHWARDVQLDEDAHRYANRNGVPVFTFLRTVGMNLLRRGGYRSIRQGFRELAYDIQGMLALGGVTMTERNLDQTFRQRWPCHKTR